jgi:hypothetical protein
MTRFLTGSTLSSLLLLPAPVASAQGQQLDSVPAGHSWAVYAGAGFGDGFQFIAGGQVWLQTPVRAISIVPELAIGHGTSLLAGVGAHVTPVSSGIRPYVGISASYLWVGSDEEDGNAIVVTPKAGVLFDTRAPLFGERSLGWMLEYQGVDFFTTHRIVVGARWSF